MLCQLESESNFRKGPGAILRFWVALFLSLLLHGVLLVGGSGSLFGSLRVREAFGDGQAHVITATLMRDFQAPRVNAGSASSLRSFVQPSSTDARGVPTISSPSRVKDVSIDGGANYFGLSKKLPTPLDEIDLNSPEITDYARQAHIVLEIIVNSSGLVDDVRVVSANGGIDNDVWIVRIIERFRRARFAPGEISGKPVSMELLITVTVE